MNFVAEHGGINVSQSQRLLQPKRWHTAKKLLERMVAKKLLVREHSTTRKQDPKAFYRLPKPEEL